jgi:hypothetical protein
LALPEPTPGLVIRYSYLWFEEAKDGAEEGRKDRPCVVVVAVRQQEGQTVVLVAPITHRPPSVTGNAIEIPATTKRRLGLDEARSWVVADDLNQFVWPGPDIRPTAAGSFTYGELPGGLFRAVRDRVLTLAREGQASLTRRTE